MAAVALSREQALAQEYLRMLDLYGDIPTVEQNARECCFELRDYEAEEDKDAQPEPVNAA